MTDNLIGDELRWQRTRNALHLACSHARVTSFNASHLGSNALPLHRLFLIPSGAAPGSRVIDEQSGRTWRLRQGMALILPARRRYRFEFATGLQLVGFHFRLEGAGGIDVLDGALEPSLREDALMEADQACAAMALATPGAWLIGEGILRVQLGRALAASWAAIDGAATRARTWQAVITRLAEAPPCGPDVASLARRLGVTRQQFTRRFRSDFGCSPRDWHRRQLARRTVARLVADRAPLADVAQELGFSDAFAMSRFVFTATGMRPSRWRLDLPLTP